MKRIALAVVPGLASGSARAETGTCLEWDVQSETGRLSVRRAKDETVWGGETLAEIGYWDAAGAERSQPLNAASGWKLERRPAEHGCRLVCRQETLGLSVTLDVSAAGDALTMNVPAGEVVESGPARLKTLRLLPRFGAATSPELAYSAGALEVRIRLGVKPAARSTTANRTRAGPGAAGKATTSAWSGRMSCLPNATCRRPARWVFGGCTTPT